MPREAKPRAASAAPRTKFAANAHQVSPEYHIVHRTGAESVGERGAALILAPLWGSMSACE
jgi:hypothetical protein